MGVDRIQESVTKCLSVCVCVCRVMTGLEGGFGSLSVTWPDDPVAKGSTLLKVCHFSPGEKCVIWFCDRTPFRQGGMLFLFHQTLISIITPRRLTHSTKPIIFHNHRTIEIRGSKMEECACLGQCSVNNVWIRWMDWSGPPVQIKGDMSVNMSKTE